MELCIAHMIWQKIAHCIKQFMHPCLFKLLKFYLRALVTHSWTNQKVSQVNEKLYLWNAHWFLNDFAYHIASKGYLHNSYELIIPSLQERKKHECNNNATNTCLLRNIKMYVSLQKPCWSKLMDELEWNGFIVMLIQSIDEEEGYWWWLHAIAIHTSLVCIPYLRDWLCVSYASKPKIYCNIHC